MILKSLLIRLALRQLFLFPHFARHGAPETEMVQTRVRACFHAGSDAITFAITAMAQK